MCVPQEILTVEFELLFFFFCVEIHKEVILMLTVVVSINVDYIGPLQFFEHIYSFSSQKSLALLGDPVYHGPSLELKLDPR